MPDAILAEINSLVEDYSAAKEGANIRLKEIVAAVEAKTITTGQALAEARALFQEFDVKRVKLEAWAEIEFRRYISHCIARGAADWGDLADYLRGGRRVTPDIRVFLIEVMLGKRKQPRAKISGSDRRQKEIELVKSILVARARGERNAVRNKGETERQVGRYLKKHKEIAEHVLRWERLFPPAVEAAGKGLPASKTRIRYYDQEWPIRTQEHFGRPDDIS